MDASAMIRILKDFPRVGAQLQFRRIPDPLLQALEIGGHRTLDQRIHVRRAQCFDRPCDDRSVISGDDLLPSQFAVGNGAHAGSRLSFLRMRTLASAIIPYRYGPWCRPVPGLTIDRPLETSRYVNPSASSMDSTLWMGTQVVRLKNHCTVVSGIPEALAI